MYKIRLSIQITIVIVTIFFLIGLFISFVLFCLCRFDLSKKVHIESQMPTVSNQNNDINIEHSRIEMFEIKKIGENKNDADKIRELSIKSENFEFMNPITEFNQTNQRTIIQNNDQIVNENILNNKNSQFKRKQPFRIKSQSLDLSHVNSRYMLYGKRSPIYRNYLIRSNRSFLGYEPNDSLE